MMDLIAKEIFDRLNDNANILPHICPPNVRNPSGNNSCMPNEYIIIDIMPVPTEAIGINSLNRIQGYINIIIVTPAGTGALRAYEIAKNLLDLFPRNLQMTYSRIDLPGYLAPALPGDGVTYQVPLVIPFVKLVR